MGEAIIIEKEQEIVVRSIFHFYGNAADEAIARLIAQDIALQWNEPRVTIRLRKNDYAIRFEIEGRYRPDLKPEEVIMNTDPANNYFRIENFARGNISFVDGIGSNTGYFLRENLLQHSTTAGSS